MRKYDQYYAFLLTLFLSVIVHFFSNPCYGQYEQLFFDHITTRDGLSQSSINYILQDKDGFLWFATFNGLNKYDGYTFKIYRKNSEASSSISSNDLFYLFEDSKGYLWIINVNNNGLDWFNPTTETFVNFSHDPSDPHSLSSNELFHVNEDSKGNIWVCAGNALNLFVPPKNDSEHGSFIRYANPDSPALVTWTYENSSNQLLVFADYLYIFDDIEKKLVKTSVQFEEGFQVNSVVGINNHLYVGSVLNGISKITFDSASGKYSKTDAGKLNVTPNRRSRIFADHNKHLWIGTEEGLYRYKPEKDEMEHFRPGDTENYSISDNIIYSLFEDRTGILWIGTFSKGLDKLDFYRKPFLHFKRFPDTENTLSGNVISSIHSIKPKDVWVGLDVGGGVNRIIFSENGEPKVFHYYLNPKEIKSSNENNVLCLVQRKNGDVWTGSAGGLVSRIIPDVPGSGKKPVIKKYRFDKWTFAIFEDSDGILWGGTWDKGLWRYNDHSDSFDFFEPDSGNKFSICDKIIWSIGEDRHKNLWIGGHGNGISVLTADEKRKNNPRFINMGFDKNKPASLSNNTINAFCQARDGNFWICTAGGLNKVINYQNISGHFDGFPEIVFHAYHMKDNLPSEGIVGIVEDNNGYIWLSTNYGLSKMDPAKVEFTNFNADHGLQSNEFWHNAYFKDAEGRIYFGGENGFNFFEPDKISPNPFTPNVVLTEVRLFNKIVSVGEIINKQVVLKEPIYRTKELVLSYKNNIVTFEFAALHFAQPAQNKYAYYLEGFENDWNYSDNHRTATYTNLNPGFYTFRVKASNNDGIWSDEEIELGITIRPPWWQTLFFKLLVPVLLSLIVLAVFRIRLRMLKKQKNILQQTVNIRTEELQAANALLEDRHEEILMQNEELLRHRHNLEDLVIERTSELEKAKLKAEESDRLKSSFLANMSHEIRTPMNAILGFSSLLKETEFSQEERDGFISTINANGETLMVLIDDILDISLIESNQLVLNHQHFDVTTILVELEDAFRLRNNKELTIDFINKSDMELIIFADPVRFRQIMNNLLSNALKYTHKGFIKFGYERKTNEICFFVADSGIGIDPKYSKDIFNSFFKIELQSDKVYRGTGIGLAICKRLVELLNGKIWVESNPGSGSTFYFSIPYATQTSIRTNANIANQEKIEVNLDQSFFIVAEDEPANYEVLVKMLRIKKDRHFWAKNGKEAVDFVEKMDNYKNVIILMDIKMPVMNGFEAMKLIKRIKPGIPVIAVTAFAMKHEEKNILSEGFDGYLAKPIIVDKLKALVSSFAEFTN